MKNSQPPTIGRYHTTRIHFDPVVSEEQDIGHSDPLRINLTEEKVEESARNEEYSEVDMKWEDNFEDIVEEEDFPMEDRGDDKLVVKDLSEKEPILVLNTKVLDEHCTI